MTIIQKEGHKVFSSEQYYWHLNIFLTSFVAVTRTFHLFNLHRCAIVQQCRGVARGGAEGARAPRNLVDQ